MLSPPPPHGMEQVCIEVMKDFARSSPSEPATFEVFLFLHFLRIVAFV